MKRSYLKVCGLLLLYIAGWLWLILDPAVLQAPTVREPFFILLVSSALLWAGLMWLRPPRPITFWKPVVYLTLIVSISMLFSMAPAELVNTFRGVCFFLEWALFAVLNAYLWENLFKITNKRFWAIYILIGFVNAALSVSSVPLIKG